MIIDCHGHYTTAPKALEMFRKAQIAALTDPSAPSRSLQISDDQVRETLVPAQLKLQQERGTDVAIFSPGAGKMAHHIGTFETSSEWSRACNNLIAQVCRIYPKSFVGVCQLPQSPGVEPKTCIPELERCVNELGFVGCNLNPDPTGAGIRCMKRWSNSTYLRWFMSRPRATPTSTAPGRTTSTAIRPPSCSS